MKLPPTSLRRRLRCFSLLFFSFCSISLLYCWIVRGVCQRGSRFPCLFPPFLQKAPGCMFNREYAAYNGELPSASVRLLLFGRPPRLGAVYDAPSPQIWSLDTAPLQTVLHGHTAPVRTVIRHRGLILSGSDDGSIRVWDTMRLLCVNVITAHTEGVRVLASDGSHVFSCGRSPTLKVRMERRKYVRTRRYTVTVRRMQVWNSSTWRPEAICETKSPISCFVVLRGGWLLSGRRDGEIVIWMPGVWSARRLCPTARTRCHDKEVTALVVLDNLLISGSEDTSMKIWQCFAQEGAPVFAPLAVVHTHGPITCVTLVDFQSTVVVMTADNRGKTKVCADDDVDDVYVLLCAMTHQRSCSVARFRRGTRKRGRAWTRCNRPSDTRHHLRQGMACTSVDTVMGHIQ